MKKIIKVTLQACLLLLTALSLFACDGGTEEAEFDEDGNKVVRIMFHVNENSPEGQAYKKRIQAFNTAYKEQKIKASATYKARTAGANDYEVELTKKQMEGSLDDIITFDAPNCASYANAGLLYNLDGLIPNEVLNDFVSISKYNNHIYGLPIQESSAGFFYNKNIFRDAGVNVDAYTVDNPWTFAEFEDVCRRLTEFQNRDLNRYSKYAVDMRLDATKDEMGTYMLYSFIHAAGGEFVSSDGFTANGYFNSSATAKGFGFIKGLVTKKYTGYDIGATDFFNGKMGLYLSSGWTIPDLDNKYRDYFPNRDSWGLLPYPKDVIAASATGSWCFAITDNGKDKSAAKELLLWMTSPESSKVITDATGMIPARKSTETNYEVGSPEYVLYNQLINTGKARPDTVCYPKFSVLFNQVITELKDGNVTDILNNKARSLQEELDLKKRG